MADKQDSSFTVCMMCRDTVYNVLRFASWYLAQGADKIHIYFDDPSDPAIQLLKGEDRIVVIPLTQERRERFGKDVSAAALQPLIGTDVYGEMETEWLLRVDCDELVVCDNGTLADYLKTVPSEVETLRVVPYEQVAIRGSDHEVFRGPVPRDQVLGIYQDTPGASPIGGGMVGHEAGKSFTRRGLKVAVREHGPRNTDRTQPRLRGGSVGARDGIACLHFNREPFEVWKRKVQWRLSHSSIRPSLGAKIIEALYLDVEAQDAGKFSKLRELYESLMSVSSTVAADLEARGALIRNTPDFDQVTLDRFGNAAVEALRAGRE